MILVVEAIEDGDVRLLQFDNSKNVADRAVSLMPELFDKVSELFSKKDKNRVSA